MVELRHELNLNLGLILTPQLDLALRVLSASQLELQEQIDELIATNPLINLDSEFKYTKPNNIGEKFKELEGAYRVKFESEEEYDELDFIEKQIDWRESLLEALMLSYNLSEEELYIAQEIIYNLDEKGFLKEEVNDEFEYIRQLIIELEPFGCASRDVVEFFHFQNKRINANKDFFESLDSFIHKAFELNLDIKKLQKLGYRFETIEFFLEKLKEFKPYPLWGFEKEENDIIVYYDIEIKKIGDRYIPIIQDEFLKKLVLNYDLIKFSKRNEDYIKEKLKQVNVFLESINMRNKTLLRIANIVVEKQKRFFDEWILTPLSMSSIAQVLNLNVSTISRALLNKYILYESKIYPFRLFFSNESKEGISKHYILGLVKDAIEKEDKKNPLDDEALRQILKHHNIHVTRRAIVKYRKELNIQKAKDRKERFA